MEKLGHAYWNEIDVKTYIEGAGAADALVVVSKLAAGYGGAWGPKTSVRAINLLLTYIWQALAIGRRPSKLFRMSTAFERDAIRESDFFC